MVGPRVPAPARFLRRAGQRRCPDSGAINRVFRKIFPPTYRTLSPPHGLARARLPKSNMAAAAAAASCSATALQAPSAAAPSRPRGVVGYGCPTARLWNCRRWAHRPDAPMARIRRLPPRRAAAAARVTCAYSTGGKARVFSV